MTTIVSGFVILPSSSSYRSMDQYIEQGQKLVDLPLPKILFLPRQVIEKIKVNNNTYIIPFEKEDLSTLSLMTEIEKIPISSPNTVKDTHLYFSVILEKTEWMRKAVKLNIFQTENFLWLDFGIYHVISDVILFEESLVTIMKKKREKVIIPGCYWPAPIERDLYNTPQWAFCGGIFIGPAEQIILFADKVKKGIREEFIDRKKWSWEINLWYLIFDPKVMEWVYGDHNDTIYHGLL